MYKKLTIDGLSQDTLGFKMLVEDFDEFVSSTTKSNFSSTGVFKSKINERNTISKDYVVYIPNCTQEKIDLFKKWALKENVKFNDYSKDRYCIAYKISIKSTKRLTASVYSINLVVELSDRYYSKNEKTVTSVGNRLTLENFGTAQTNPVFSFRALSDIRMFSLVHPTKGTFQIGESSGSVVISAGVVVKIDMSDGSIILGSQRRIYAHVSSKTWGIDVGTTEIGIAVNQGATLPSVMCKIREAYL